MRRREPTLFDLIEENGAEAGVREYHANPRPTPTLNASEPVDVRENANLGPLFFEVAALHAEIRGMLAVIEARRPIPYADPDA